MTLSHSARRSSRSVAVALLATTALALGACSGSSSPKAAPGVKATTPSTAATTTPTTAPATTAENPAFVYQKIAAGTDLSKLGKVSMVVAARQNGADAVKAIHA